MISTPRSRAKVNNGFININPSTVAITKNINKFLTFGFK